ncbi:MAG: iron ABC transporter permease [Phocaeicola sp.]|nr:iron ABC transporter permease [Phocaeicola sp.]
MLSGAYTRTASLLCVLSMLIVLAFVMDIMYGSISLSIEEVWRALVYGDEQASSTYIIRNFRLPKALTALFAGAGIAIAGLQMQSLFHNPLADTSILGINSGAGVGVAMYTMAYSLFPSVAIWNSGVAVWGVIISACLGSAIVLLLIAMVASRVHSIVSVLIVGVMVGFLASAIISILQFFSDEETLKTYLLWSFGSVTGTTWKQLYVLLPIITTGLCLALMMPKPMNALALGERYAHSVGINVSFTRFALIGITSLLAGSITAFTGPIAFLGLAVPHFVRILFKTSDHRILIPATMLVGALLLLVCDLLTQVPGKGMTLPINALTSLIGAPVVIAIIIRNHRSNQL